MEDGGLIKTQRDAIRLQVSPDPSRFCGAHAKDPFLTTVSFCGSPCFHTPTFQGEKEEERRRKQRELETFQQAVHARVRKAQLQRKEQDEQKRLHQVRSIRYLRS